MPTRLRLYLTALCYGALAAPLVGQGAWVTPQPPCELNAGHFKVTGALLYLKTAAEKPTQRDQQLAQARRVLTEAIVQNAQEKNGAAWYYLGRYYFEVNDAAGADSAFARAVALAPQCRQDVASYRPRLWATTLNAGLAAWQAGKEDSATALFRLAAQLEPANPQACVRLAGPFCGKDNYASALVHSPPPVDAAGNDTAFAKARKEAIAKAARMPVGRALNDPAAQPYGSPRSYRG